MGVAASKSAQEAMRATGASAASLVIGPVRRASDPQVVFYQLSHKFVDDERTIPPDSADIVYYTLAVGHHTGVIDCFDERMSCSLSTYESICALFSEGDARYKLEGVVRSGEIQVDRGNLAVLDAPVKEVLSSLGVGEDGEDTQRTEQRAWLTSFSAALDTIKADSVVYLMGRKRLP